MSLLPPSKEKLAIENIIAPRTAPEFAGFVVVTVSISLLTAAAGSSLPGTIFGALCVAVVGFIWWRVDRARAKARAQRLYSDLAISVDKEAPGASRFCKYIRISVK